MTTEGRYLFEPTILMAEFRATWAEIAYAWKTLHVDHLIIEDDSITVVTWIQEGM